ncbi:outer membrane lipoprotein carrier protein, LolA family [Hyphomonas neptunium ATCC 15444]|uniref:Outer membrane lipoprotein carrier protein, LolA family n=2 Tax=Hyphomonas TaxID=85 RepID=Q0BWC4_HYPNA|nr:MULTISPECIES: outer membrane lipoprotein carrier protein LolA [Hyphomonas]ABI77261.1 outer membrane lipoprotein carrier protein, LolA family [Hyphomonas neptunium ATCC 15444]KCZ94794.1 LolA family outer membrane lipoprotein carrier protein [Hyphomonas hirschiana VP5]
MMNFFAPIAAAAMIAGASPLLPALKQAPVSPAVAAPATAAQLSNAERATILKQASSALAGVKTARGRFEQYSPDGAYSTGQFAMQRPGKVRFDYDDPVPLLMVSDGTTVALQDADLETTDRVPLGSTPLSLLLSDRLDFESQANVLDVRRANGTTNITVQDKAGEMEGTLTLVLSEADNSLVGWRSVDANGGNTSVQLSDIETGAKLNPRLFILRDFDNN